MDHLQLHQARRWQLGFLMSARLAVFAGFFLSPMAWAANGSTVWSAGVARVSITPGPGVWMGGYASRNRPAEGKLTDLWVKALALEDGTGSRALLVTADLIGMDRQLSLSIRNAISKKYGLPLSGVVLNFSHTHSGPVVGEVLAPQQQLDESQQKLVSGYAVSLRERTITAAGQAIGRLTPCHLAWAVGRCQFAVNRRENKETLVPDLIANNQLKGPTDHAVPVLQVTDRSRRKIAIVFGYACHATVTRFYKWSGDYPGFAQIGVEEAHPEAVSMFWAGCGADQNPLPRRTVQLAREYGRELAAAVNQVVRSQMTPVTGALTTAYSEEQLAFGQGPTLEETRTLLQSRRQKDVNWATIMLARRKRLQTLPVSYPYPITVWQLGDGPQMIFLGGEVVVDYSLRMKAEHMGPRTWVAGYSNDVMNYIPSRRVFREGGYEGLTGMYSYGRHAPWTPDVEQTIVSAVHRLAGNPTE